MKILWVKAGKLLPLDTGGKIRSYNVLKNLAPHNEVTLLSYYGGQRDKGYESELERQFSGGVALHIPRLDNKHWFAILLHYILHLTSPAPYAVSKFTAPELQETVSAWINGDQFDLAVCDFLSASLNFPLPSLTPVVLFQHNIETELWKRLAATEGNWARKFVYRLEAAKMARYERKTIGKFDFVIAVSERDREQLAKMTDLNRIAVSPTGVDCAKYRTSIEQDGNDVLVAFTGSMDWEPNIDCVEYFCNEIWPLIHKKVPFARFRIVGRNPHPRVRRLVCDSVEVTGTVSSIIEHLREAAVVVVPLRIGGGTRLKIYEAMAMGKPVVSTTIGAEGLDVQHGRDILFADCPEVFCSSVTALLTDQALRTRIGTAAAEKASHYDWPQVASRFEQLLRHAAVAHRIHFPQLPGV